ncbi:hypothetical protein CC86DRAFT_410202 [Ophiobolus disseminans]|uniref:Zn(2)-C6 fungal-type domain-containing protein n=1 Tax=Ophiobolus disseminans TaxID=1469910 RepID=A0A6A6ZP05_9PLEO|nr:hypothetical protein CC86DRAFT_410202 [Ophiobolus disseminans]
MRKTLRRSCDACARSKLRCDLLTPQCSRCSKADRPCVYANEPLTSPLTEDTIEIPAKKSPKPDVASVHSSVANLSISCHNPANQSFDPFHTYPQTRLPRARVEFLIQHFLSNIAFQYYPLDKNAASNPFVVSWFPLALADPALFHVSLQTASLDMELREQKGFATSDILMADSVSLVRLKIANPVLAIQDETMDAVITLAAIELGKGNVAITQLHIDGLVSMVRMRGGIQRVKTVSPLTARMVSWVTMIALLSPQFGTQDDNGRGDGIAPVPQWIEIANCHGDHVSSPFNRLSLEPAIGNILHHLRNIFHGPKHSGLSTADFHDLVCFVLHRLLEPTHARSPDTLPSSTSESVRHALALYLLIVHGPTYFSHVQLQYSLTQELKRDLDESLDSTVTTNASLTVWLLSVGMVASYGSQNSQYFTAEAGVATMSLGLRQWEDVLFHLKETLWLEEQQAEHTFQQAWDGVWSGTT